MRVAVIGAGVAGLACARALTAAGHAVAVFDKGRGPGGRMSAKRWQVAGGEHRVDLGAQYFTVRSDGFRAALAGLGDAVAAWAPRLPGGARAEGWFVGAPAMGAVAKGLAAELDVRLGVVVAPPERAAGGWRLASVEGAGLGTFDAVVVATPAEQAGALLAAAPEPAAAARAARTAPCWAAGLWVEGGDPGFDAARDPVPGLGWLARHAGRPGRSDAPIWIAHASAEWSRANLESEAADVLRELSAMAAGVLGAPPAHGIAHRWRFALVEQPAAPAWDAELGIGACGDWCSGPRVELAWASGDALGRAMAGDGPRAAR